MGNLLKSSLLLLFTTMLSFASIQEVACKDIYQASAEKKGTQAAETSFSQSEQVKFLFSHKADELQVAPINQTPAPNAKDQAFGFLNAFYALEFCRHSLASQYLAHTGSFCQGLSGYSLIFPFQYFW
ncbi:hypothetical protein ACSX1A_05875 [Pontibacter sp. MBLB2868]|uniref:hypothetical protein n=1 Tax=Pontibacter sp. MBLB2868 TaxID=3451555 RepID=UPI003F753BB8